MHPKQPALEDAEPSVWKFEALWVVAGKHTGLVAALASGYLVACLVKVATGEVLESAAAAVVAAAVVAAAVVAAAAAAVIALDVAAS